MLGSTHAAFALLVGLIVLHAGVPANPLLALILAVLGALLPDVDEARSILGRRTKLAAWLFPHRGVFHSIIMAIFLTILLYGIRPDSALALFFLAGYLSHVVGDLLTPKGAQPFWPSRLRIRGPIRVGKGAERLLFWILIMVDGYLVVVL